MSLPNNPQTRKEMYLSNMAGQGTALPSEPHTREEEYLDFIAKNGGGGGTGDGDMKKSVYDGDLAVAGAGGIKSYVTDAISGKVDKAQGKGLSTNDYDNSAKAIVDGVTTTLDAKQPKTLSEPIYVDGIAKFSVETAIDAVNDLAASNKSSLLTKADTSDIAAIQDGQNIDSFSDVETALDSKVDNSKIGANNGVAGLDANGRVPSSQLPSYVDDVLEYASQSAFPATGETGKIYIALDTNKTYRWSGSAYVEISESLALGETASSAYAGNKGKANADAIAAIKDGSSIDSFGDVEEALAEKVDKVQGKGLSTNDYNNTAKGIVDNIQSNVIANTKLIKDTVGWSGKNKLIQPYPNKPLNEFPYVNNDITYTCGTDFKITANKTGTNTRESNIALALREDNAYTLKLPKGKYIFSGNATTDGRTKLQVATTKNGSYYQLAQTTEKEVEFEVTDDILVSGKDYATIALYLLVTANADVSNEVFEPMIRDADILDPTYEPYFGSTAVDWASYAKTGVHNYVVVTTESGSNKGLSWTVNDDKSITLDTNGSPTTGDLTIEITDIFKIPAGNYILSSRETSQPSNIHYNISAYNGSTVVRTIKEVQSVDNQPFTIDYSDYNLIRVRLWVKSGTTINNVTCKLMIQDSQDPSDDYSEGAMTNLELTKKKADITAVGTDESGHITASKAYSLNDYFYKNGELCLAKTDIANGDSLIDEGNYTKQSIGFALHGKVGVICPTFSGDCDDLLAGTVYATGSATHVPTGWCIVHTFSSGLSLTNPYMTQLAMPVNQDALYYRKKSNGTWGAWYKLEGTVVS